MLELRNNALVFSFPEVHPEANLTIEFQRTLRIPDDGRDYPLPPGLGRFPMVHIDDHRDRVPSDWLKRGGVLLPMYQSEAMWLNFVPHHPTARASAYPFAVKVAAGKINAVNGKPWSNELAQQAGEGSWFEEPTDYMVVPQQPWLDGYYVDKGRIRQFIAMPLGSGYSAEEQLTGKAEFGGVQIIVYPMRGDVYERRFPAIQRSRDDTEEIVMYDSLCADESALPQSAMALGAGGSMKQEIYSDPFEFDDWARDRSSRCFVHLVNSATWREVTRQPPPHVPPTSREYEQSGLPWFDYYGESANVSSGGSILDKVKSVFQLGEEKGEKPLPENESVNPKNVVSVNKKNPHEVLDGDF